MIIVGFVCVLNIFDPNRVVTTGYKTSSGVTGRADAIEFPYAIRGNYISSLGIPPDADVDFYVRTKSGDILLQYENKVVTHFRGKYNTMDKYCVGLGVLVDTSDPLYFQPLDELISDPKTFKIHNPRKIHLYTLDYGGLLMRNTEKCARIR